VNTPLFPQVPDYHLVYELRERGHPLVFTDDLVVHLLELPKFTKTAAELATPLDVWLYFLRHGERLDAAALAAVEEVNRAMGELVMIAQSDVERERYEARLQLQRDISTALAEARDDGLEQGLEQGRKEGQVRQIHFCEGLLRRAPTPAAQLLALPLAELERLTQQLEAEVTRASSPAS
jgi:predicted transposase/invertase (TIGR01784 family)